ncbi:TrkH family potassium uptake protein [Lentibacillus sp. Marseille-P4043]|uniref:TrkH family potassium uptake protein n=1 Tax=Lentibacillus sp. Marseille-P4043 TaxID=2040293 RepID=UPI000D0AED8B|nr:TrkH family potassium uptake protein [Lentibacillus sp. Marseille-P4043]
MFSQHPLIRIINKLSPVQLILIFYFIAVIVSTALLALPVTHRHGVDVPLIDLFFTAVSAMSVTGLSTISIADTFNTTGIIVLALILQLGGVGVMAIGTFIWILLGKKIGLKERRLIMTDQNQTTFEGMVRLIKQILLVILTIEFIGFIILGTYFLQYFPTAGEAYLNGFFGSISATTNGGFDITGDSLITFKDDYFVQFINILLIIFGAIGYPVLVEVKEYLFSKSDHQIQFRFSLFTKVTTLTFFALIIVGTTFIFLLDANHFFSGKSWHEILFYSLFQSVTTRSGGLATMDVSQLTEQNHLFMSLLMFIGASPSSAGGGIRTTTFALVIIFIITFARGGNSIRLFKREIHDEDLLKAVTVMLMAIFFVYSSVVVMSIVEPYSLSQLLFEVTSAFGTVGLSLGITGDLTAFSKVILMILMFIGRVGIITFLLMFKKSKNTGKYHYPKEKIIIG